MRNLISLLILSGLFTLLFSCGGVSPEQEKILDGFKKEISETSMAVGEALTVPADLLIKLNEKSITPIEFKRAMSEAKAAISDAQNNFYAATKKYDEAKEAGISNAQIAYSVIGGVIGRSILHALAGYLSGMSGLGGILGGLAATALGGSKSKNIEVVPDS